MGIRKPQNRKSRFVELATVALAKLKRLPSGNRNLSSSHIKKLTKEWDDNVVGTFTLSCRDDGSYWILDGQHRHEVLLRKGRLGDLVRAEVHYGLTHDEELEFCEKFNSNRRDWTAVDRFRLRLELGSPDALAIESIVHRNGFKLNLIDGKHSDSRIAAVGTLVQIYEQFRPGMLDQVLQMIAEARGTNTGMPAFVLRGVASIISAYEDHPNYNRARMVKALRDTEHVSIKHLGLRSSEAVAYQCVEEFNTGLRTKKLPSWFLVSRTGSR